MIAQEWIVPKWICLLDANPIGSASVQTDLVELGFDSVVTIRNHRDAFLWAVPGSSLRHYQFGLSDYVCPSAWDLHCLNEYCLYELAHGRRVAIWIEDDSVQGTMIDSLHAFFAPVLQDLGFIVQAMDTQRERVRALLPLGKVTRCRFCAAQGCMTDLLCHATDIETAHLIVDSGRMLSARRARGEADAVLVGEPRNAAGDPVDYFDYVMFAAGNCPGPDKLVYERNVGRVPSWDEFAARFRPAVKFFFRIADLVNHPGFRTDGYHLAKIRDELVLAPWLQAVVVPRGVPGVPALIALAEAKLPGVKRIALDFSGHTPQSWAHTAYLAAREESV